MRLPTAVIETERATFPPARWVSTCEMFPGGQQATRIIPRAIDGVTGRISVRTKVTAGSTISWARIAMMNVFGLRATTLKSSTVVSRAMPNMIRAQDDVEDDQRAGVEVQHDVVGVHAGVLFFEGRDRRASEGRMPRRGVSSVSLRRDSAAARTAPR